jgi:hypothetical protein
MLHAGDLSWAGQATTRLACSQLSKSLRLTLNRNGKDDMRDLEARQKVFSIDGATRAKPNRESRGRNCVRDFLGLPEA